MPEIATVHRYRGGDGYVPDGTLVAVSPADYDDEKSTIWFTLPDLSNPECSAYTDTDLGPELAAIEIVDREEEPWGMVPADPSQVSAVVAAAEAEERHCAELMADPRVIAAIRTLLDLGVTANQVVRALADPS